MGDTLTAPFPQELHVQDCYEPIYFNVGYTGVKIARTVTIDPHPTLTSECSVNILGLGGEEILYLVQSFIDS